MRHFAARQRVKLGSTGRWDYTIAHDGSTYPTGYCVVRFALEVCVSAMLWFAVFGAAVRAWEEGMRLFRVCFLMLVVVLVGASSARAQSDPRLLNGYADGYRLIHRDAYTVLAASLPALPIDVTATEAASPGMRKKLSVSVKTPANLTPAEFEAYLRSRFAAVLAVLASRTLQGTPTRYGLPPHTRSGSDSLTTLTERGPGVPLFTRHTVNDAGEHTIYFELIYG